MFKEKYTDGTLPSSPKYAGKTQIDVWKAYKYAENEIDKQEALEELYLRHNLMFVKLAHNAHNKHPEVGTLEDFIQLARVGAMLAYENYNIEKSIQTSSKLSTYVSSCAYHYILSSIDSNWFIACPPQKRSIRTYLKGGYDTNETKKKEFEEKNNIDSESDVETLRERYKLLVDSSMSQLETEYYINTNIAPKNALVIEPDVDEDNIVLALRIDEVKSKLSSRNKDIFDMFFVKEWSAVEISKKTNWSINEVRNSILQIRKHFKSSMKEDFALI